VGVVVYISRDVLDAIKAEAVAAGATECCGLLLSTNGSGRIDALRRAENDAAAPESCFEIDPQALVAAYRAQRSGGPTIVGHYHSHPGGDPAPSQADAAQAEARGEIWLICTGDGNHAAAWIAHGTGSVHNVFDPAKMIVD